MTEDRVKSLEEAIRNLKTIIDRAKQVLSLIHI